MQHWNWQGFDVINAHERDPNIYMEGMREAIDLVAKVSGRKPPRGTLPAGLMKALTPIGPLVGKLIGQPPNLRELISSADKVTFWASYDKAARELGYSPRGMEEGMRQTLEADDRFPSSAA